MSDYCVIVHSSEILTGAGVRQKRGRRILESDLGRIPDGALVYGVRRVGDREVPDKIEWVGPTAELPSQWNQGSQRSQGGQGSQASGRNRIKTIDLQGKQAIVPGFVDCHNHLIFAGDRSDEFAARCGGASYEEIAKQGGGIQSTVRATRLSSASELEALAMKRLEELYAYGVRTVEIKSGYGLSTEDELKILGVIPKLRQCFPQMTLTATFLGAHAFPPEKSREGHLREEYLKEIIDEMLPQVARKQLADSCDVFIDEGYFSVQDGRKILGRAKELGLKVKIHADELVNTESASLAVELKALSADHLLKVSDRGIQDLAASDTVAVLLPGTAFYLKMDYAPARKLLDAGATVALATDFNPGTCMCLSLPAIMTIAALYLKMTRAEIFSAVTYNAAKALGLDSTKGTLEVGMDADFVVLPFSRFEEVYYRFAWAP